MTKPFSITLCFLLPLCIQCSSSFGCNSHATIFRQLEREGFHVDANLLIELVIDLETSSKWENCSLLLIEKISNYFYVNPDQLLELSRSELLYACTKDKVNIESPQYLSEEHTLYIYSQFQKSQNLIFTHLRFPLHLRYQKPKVNGGYSLAELASPILLIQCPKIECINLSKHKAPCHMCGKDLCSWSEFPYKTNNINFTMPVPVGDLNHLWFIYPLTYSLTFGSCFYVVLAIIVSSSK